MAFLILALAIPMPNAIAATTFTVQLSMKLSWIRAFSSTFKPARNESAQNPFSLFFAADSLVS